MITPVWESVTLPQLRNVAFANLALVTVPAQAALSLSSYPRSFLSTSCTIVYEASSPSPDDDDDVDTLSLTVGHVNSSKGLNTLKHIVWLVDALTFLPLTRYPVIFPPSTLSLPGEDPSSLADSAVSRGDAAEGVRIGTVRSPYDGSPSIWSEVTRPFSVLRSTAVCNVTHMPFAPVEAGLSWPMLYRTIPPAIVAVKRGFLPSSKTVSGGTGVVVTAASSPSLKTAHAVTLGAAC
mmetsp:Transcript_20963/g.50933  ORF Transcript_20963/g.50933 Transcript_20963/m.50933 type:complete len:236 (-) Transcript_20963:271-978(-)